MKTTTSSGHKQRGWAAVLSVLCTSLLGLLGFLSCGRMRYYPSEYGTPYQKYMPTDTTETDSVAATSPDTPTTPGP